MYIYVPVFFVPVGRSILEVGSFHSFCRKLGFKSPVLFFCFFAVFVLGGMSGSVGGLLGG